MRIITKARLRQFWQSPGHEDAEGPLRAWYTHVNNKSVAWQSWGDVKADFGKASLVGNCSPSRTREPPGPPGHLEPSRVLP